MADAAAFESLIKACSDRGLSAVVRSDPEKGAWCRVSCPGAHGDLAENVEYGADGELRAFFFSWGEKIGLADDPEWAAERLSRVVRAER